MAKIFHCEKYKVFIFKARLDIMSASRGGRGCGWAAGKTPPFVSSKGEDAWHTWLLGTLRYIVLCVCGGLGDRRYCFCDAERVYIARRLVWEIHRQCGDSDVQLLVCQRGGYSMREKWHWGKISPVLRSFPDSHHSSNILSSETRFTILAIYSVIKYQP